MKVFGKYEVLEELDSSANIRIFRGHDRIIQRDVLLKVFHVESMAPIARQRFVREVLATVALIHPNIVSIYDFAVQNEYAYLAMEQLEGESLRDFLNRKGHRTLESKLQFMIEICEGLAFAHEKGVIHRDIRPENIFVMNSGRPKILDFAIAGALMPMSLSEGFALTAMEYRAPEQARRQRGDAVSDIFSASAVFFELLTNSHPFPGMDVSRKLQMESSQLMARFDPALPRQLSRLIARGLSADPSYRLQSAADFAQELRMIAAEQALASAKLAEEVIGLREKVFELRNRLALDSPQIQARLSAVDLSILERMTPEFLAAISSEMDYFSIVELQKECLQTLGSIERIVAEDVASQKAPFQELDLSFKAAAEKVSTPPKVVSIAEEKLSQLDHAIESGNISRILSLVSEVSRRKRKWFGEYSATEIELKKLEDACRKGLDSVVEITQSQISSAISRGDFAAAEEHIQVIEKVCSRDSSYAELAGQIREQIREARQQSEPAEPAEPRTRSHTVELISEPGRMCPGCRYSNPMEAVVCESCGLRLPGTRRLTPSLEAHSPARKRAVPIPNEFVNRKLSYGRLFAAAGALILVVAIVVLLLLPRPPKVAAEAPVIGKAIVTKDSLLRSAPGVDDKATAVVKGEGLDLLSKLPDMKSDAWIEVRRNADGKRGFVRMADLSSVHTDHCSFDLWHAALLLPGMEALDKTQKSERVRQVEAEMSRCPESVTDDLRMTMAETYTHQAAALPWKSAQNDIREARAHLSKIQNQGNYASRVDAVNHTLEDLAPAQTPPPQVQLAPPPAPVPAKGENVDVAEKLLKQGKADLENAETRAQLNMVIANMNSISNMSFTEPRGLAIQAEARKIRDKASNSLGLVK